MTATDNLGNITLYNADNIEVMKQFGDKQFDLAIVDPPYGINATKMQMGSAPNRKGRGEYPSVSTAVKVKGRLNSGGGKLKGRLLNNSDCSWDSEPPTPEYFEQLFRVSKNQIIWGGNYFDLPPTRCIICWDKMQPWENFSQWEMAWTSFDKPAALFRYSNTGGGIKKRRFIQRKNQLHYTPGCYKNSLAVTTQFSTLVLAPCLSVLLAQKLVIRLPLSNGTGKYTLMGWKD